MNNFIKQYGILWLRIEVRLFFKGIYYISKENQKWLTLLSKDLDKADVQRTVEQIETLTEESERQHGDSVLQVAVKENKTLFRRMKEEGNMCEALRELFEPEMNEAIQNTRKEMIAEALKMGSSAQDISKVMGIPLAEIEAIAKGN